MWCVEPEDDKDGEQCENEEDECFNLEALLSSIGTSLQQTGATTRTEDCKVLHPTFASEDIEIEGHRRITCDKPQWLESYVVRNATENQYKMMEMDYEHHLSQQKKVGVPLGLGNIRKFISTSLVDK